MRIISGTHKGRRLTAPKTLPVRPTTDFAKEALFNILNNQFNFSEISLLDLFAGTGNISYEFASRGTKTITAVDIDLGCVKFIENTSERLSMPIKAIKGDVFKFIETKRLQANIVFADPPYDFEIDQLAQIATNIFQNEFLPPNGLLIIEHSKQTDLSDSLNFEISRKYGNCVFSFFRIS